VFIFVVGFFSKKGEVGIKEGYLWVEELGKENLVGVLRIFVIKYSFFTEH
jgi:hypothetical protein